MTAGGRRRIPHRLRQRTGRTAGWLVVLLLACARKGAPPAPAAAAVIVQAHGGVTRGRPGQAPATALTGGALAEGEILETAGDGGALVLLAPGRQVELAPNTRLALRLDRGALVVDLQQGSILSRTPEQGAAPEVALDVLTPFGITRIPRGPSAASIAVADGHVRIDVSQGAITFIDTAGREVSAGARQSIAVSMGHVELLGPPPDAAPAPEPLEVVLSAEVGSLLVERPGEPRFTARRALPAPPGTRFRLDAGGRARLGAPGLRARLQDAAGTIGEAQRGATGRHLALALDRGTAVLALEGGEAEEVAITGPGRRGEVTLRVTEPTTFLVVAGRDGPTVTVLAGAAEVTSGEDHRRLGAGEQGRRVAGRWVVGTRAQSEVILPTARAMRVYADGLGEVTLSWPHAPAPPFVEVASDADFKDLLLAGRVQGDSITVPAPRSSDLFWRVTSGDKVKVGSAHFEPDSHRSVLDLEHPRNLITENGPVTTVYFQGVVPTLTFSYAVRPGAARYRLRVYREGALDQPLVEKVVADTRCPVEAGVLREGSYLWHAVPLDPAGAELGGGRMSKLELVYDNSLTRLAIGSPKPGARAEGKEIETLGVAPLGSKLYINGKATPLDGKGRFATRVGRAPSLVYRVVGRNGAESYWIRRLARGR